MQPPRLRGIITPLVTPLTEDQTLDRGSSERVIEHVLTGGVHGLFVLGTTGEGPLVSARVRQELVEHVCRQVAGRAPVLVGVTDLAFADSVNLACVAAKAGAAAVVTAGPLYYSVPQPLLLDYCRRLAAQSPLPVYLYNAPSCSHVSFAIDTVAKAAAVENIAGIKDSSGDMGYVHQLLRILADRPEFDVLVGPEELLAESILLGAHGGVNGGSNLFPRLYVSLYEAAVRGDLALVRRLHASVVEVCARIFEAGPYGTHYLQGLKYAAFLLGLCGETVSLPYGPLDVVGKGRIAADVEFLQQLPGVAA